MKFTFPLFFIFFLFISACSHTENKILYLANTNADLLNKKPWHWDLFDESFPDNQTADWYYGDESYQQFWEDPGGVRRMTLILPPYAIHKESIKNFITKVKTSKVTKYSKYEEALYLNYPGNEPDKKVILDIKRRGLLVIRENSPQIECYLYRGWDESSLGAFDKVMYIDFPENITNKQKMNLRANDIAKIITSKLNEPPNIKKLLEPGTIIAKDNYHDYEFWNAHDLKFISLIFNMYRECSARGMAEQVKKAKLKQQGNGEQEFEVDSDGTYPERRFVLDRKRQRLLVFIESGTVKSLRRINGELTEYNYMGKTPENLYYLTSEQMEELANSPGNKGFD